MSGKSNTSVACDVPALLFCYLVVDGLPVGDWIRRRRR